MAPLLRPGDRVGLVACSNPLPPAAAASVQELVRILREMGLNPVCSPLLYAGENFFTGARRAAVLENFYRDPEIRAVFDISGGDLAMDVLGHLDFSVLRETPKPLFGYSDLTVLLNAIYTELGRESWLYQVRWLADRCGERQRSDFAAAVFGEDDRLLRCRWTFLRGAHMAGVLAGGNIRCLLKLAGTGRFPDLRGKLMLLESNGGTPALVLSQLQQLRQMGVFEKTAGVLLGTFVAMEDSGARPAAPELLLEVLGDSQVPAAMTPDVGHRPDSRALVIGRYLEL